MGLAHTFATFVLLKRADDSAEKEFERFDETKF
jgi:hypothetical protein